MDPEMRSYITNTAETFSASFKQKLGAMKKVAIKNNVNLTSLNSIITELEPLILTHLEHLSDQIKLPLNWFLSYFCFNPLYVIFYNYFDCFPNLLSVERLVLQPKSILIQVVEEFYSGSHPARENWFKLHTIGD